MVIKLTGADFSADYIEKIDVNNFDEFTTAAITASGNSSMTSAEKVALDTFFETIGAFDSSGIFAQMDYIFLPMIAGSLDYALVNYVDNSTPLTPSSSTYTLQDRGLIGLSSTASSNSRLTITDSEDFDLSNFSLIGMPMSYLNTCYFARVYSATTSSYRSTIYTVKNSSSQQTITNMYGTGSQYYATSISTSTATEALPLAVSHDSSSTYLCVTDGAINSGSTNASFYDAESGSRKIDVIGNLSGYGNISTYSPVGALLIGKTLTSSQLLTAYNAVLDLYSVFATS